MERSKRTRKLRADVPEKSSNKNRKKPRISSGSKSSLHSKASYSEMTRKQLVRLLNSRNILYKSDESRFYYVDRLEAQDQGLPVEMAAPLKGIPIATKLECIHIGSAVFERKDIPFYGMPQEVFFIILKHLEYPDQLVVSELCKYSYVMVMRYFCHDVKRVVLEVFAANKKSMGKGYQKMIDTVMNTTFTPLTLAYMAHEKDPFYTEPHLCNFTGKLGHIQSRAFNGEILRVRYENVNDFDKVKRLMRMIKEFGTIDRKVEYCVELTILRPIQRNREKDLVERENKWFVKRLNEKVVELGYEPVLMLHKISNTPIFIRCPSRGRLVTTRGYTCNFSSDAHIIILDMKAELFKTDMIDPTKLNNFMNILKDTGHAFFNNEFYSKHKIAIDELYAASYTKSNNLNVHVEYLERVKVNLEYLKCEEDPPIWENFRDQNEVYQKSTELEVKQRAKIRERKNKQRHEEMQRKDQEEFEKIGKVVTTPYSLLFG